MGSVIGVFRGQRDELAVRFDLGLDRLAHRGIENVDTVSAPCGILGVARYGWECQPALAGPAEVVASGDWVAAADGTLYYRADLRRRLRLAGVTSGETSAAGLILQAFRAWGPDCLDYLEGDFAFVLWDRSTDEVFAARDFAGSRPLYWAEVAGRLTVTSGVDATLATAGLEPRLVSGAIAVNVSGYPSLDESTHYQGVFALPAGHCVHWRPGLPGRVTRWWDIPSGGPTLPEEEAAHELRSLLVSAVEERAVGDQTNALWLSGGWDSTAVLGAALQSGGTPQWQAVSISYPQDDPGREDDLIAGVADFCSVPVAWVDSEALPVLAAPERGPFGHTFAGWLRGLASRSSESGARVSFSGYGGDQLFQASDVFLADLLRHGRLLALGREWMHPRWRGETASFLRWAVKPALSPGVRHTMASLRGNRTMVSHLDRGVPPWVTEEAAEGVRADLLATVPREPDEDHAAHEMRWYLTDPYFPAVNCLVSEIALECGTEMRTPLMDQRIVRLARTRPQEERSSRGETKRLLRRAMVGLLPPEVLQARVRRTGTTGEYFRRGLRRGGEWVPELFRHSRLADTGLIRSDVFLRWWQWFVDGGEGPWEVALCATVQAERWLREVDSGFDAAAVDLATAAN